MKQKPQEIFERIYRDLVSAACCEYEDMSKTKHNDLALASRAAGGAYLLSLLIVSLNMKVGDGIQEEIQALLGTS